MSRLLAFLLGAAVVVATLTVGAVVMEQMDTDIREAAISQAEVACNSNLPGGNWTVINRSVNSSRLGEVQSLVCRKDGVTRDINVSIQIEVQG